MSIFSDIKERTDISKVIESYGITLKNNKACCPFHSEKTPSFHVNAKKQYFRCFGCNEGGDSIAFVSRLFGLSPIEAAKKINEDFGLCITLSKPDRKAVSEFKMEKEIIDAYNSWLKQTNIRLRETFREYWKWQRDEVPFSAKWCIAVRNIDVTEYQLDILASDDEKTKMEWFTEELQKGWCVK